MKNNVTLKYKNSYPKGNEQKGYPLRPGAAMYCTDKRMFGFFEGDRYWRTEDKSRSVKIGYPRLIREEFHDSPTHIDAALCIDGVTYAFKDGFTWRWTLPGRLDPGYPRPFYGGFAGLKMF